MGDLCNHNYAATLVLSLSPSSLLLLLLLLLLTLPSVSPATDYTLPMGYFINCGSAGSVEVDSRSFTGDSKTSSVSFTKEGSSEAVSSISSSGLYRTARIFRAQNSSYSFMIQGGGSPHFVRLHFSAFVSADGDRLDLSDARFNVSVRGITLLSNFTIPVGGGNSNNSSTVKEFLLTINGDVFDVYFFPIGSSSFAFVNALEVFPVPEGIVPNPASILSFGPQGQNGNFTVNGRQVLATRYRVNVGGSRIEPGFDTLRRQWSTDDDFLWNPAESQLAIQDQITYQSDVTGVDNYTAPEAVYRTARHFRNQTYPHITWRFNVVLNSRYIFRFHFCDIIGMARNSLWFKLYLFDNTSTRIDPYEEGNVQYAVPFKKDLEIESGRGQYIDVGIRNDTGSTMLDAYLNGLEVMEVIGLWNWNSTASTSKENHAGMITGVAIGSFGVLVILVGILALISRRRKCAESVTLWSILPVFCGFDGSYDNKSIDPSISSNSPLPNLHLDLKIPLSEILSATNNFDSKLMIGRGGFGNVYRGILKNGMPVAVKRSEPGSSQGQSEFQTEIIVLSKIRHRHLVALIGYCYERSEMILVYEFLEKGTLRDHLYNTDLPVLPWKQRLETCIGAARGLHYLHTGAAGGIIHRDVKSTNILLDSNYIAKVADFGLSKLGSSLVDQSKMSTCFKGTFGYIDPEYMKTQQLTEKSDVYAFGVVLLEVLCARPAIDNTLPRHNLADWGIANFQKGTLETIIDPSLSGQTNPNSLRKFVETAEKCLREDDQERPSMGDILWDLEYALQLQQSSAARQLHEDSTTTGSSMLGFSAEVQRLPSFSRSFLGDDSAIMKENKTNTSKQQDHIVV